MKMLLAAVATVLIATPLLAAPQQTVTPRAGSAPAAKVKPLPPGVVEIQLVDLHCKTCAKKLARKLYPIPGVLRVKSSLKKDLVTVTLQKKKRVSARVLWDAAIAADLAPVEIRFAAKRLTAKDFPKAKTASRKPSHAPPAAKR